MTHWLETQDQTKSTVTLELTQYTEERVMIEWMEDSTTI